MASKRSATYRKWLDKVFDNPDMMAEVPENIMDIEFCEKTAEFDGRVLEYIPYAFRTRDVCMLACKSFEGAIQNVPKHLVDREMCLAAMSCDEIAIDYMEDSFKTNEICELAVQARGGYIEYVPVERMTPQICHIAFEATDYALRFIPDYFKDDKGNLLPIEEMEQIWAEMHPEQQDDEGPCVCP